MMLETYIPTSLELHSIEDSFFNINHSPPRRRSSRLEQINNTQLDAALEDLASPFSELGLPSLFEGEPAVFDLEIHPLVIFEDGESSSASSDEQPVPSPTGRSKRSADTKSVSPSKRRRARLVDVPVQVVTISESTTTVTPPPAPVAATPKSSALRRSNRGGGPVSPSKPASPTSAKGKKALAVAAAAAAAAAASPLPVGTTTQQTTHSSSTSTTRTGSNTTLTTTTVTTKETPKKNGTTEINVVRDTTTTHIDVRGYSLHGEEVLRIQVTEENEHEEVDIGNDFDS